MSKFTSADNGLNAAVLDQYSDPVLYIPASFADDDEPLTIAAIFDTKADMLQVGADGFADVSVLQPTLDVRLSDLPFEPVSGDDGDHVIVNPGTPQEQEYIVSDSKPSDDWTKLILRRVVSP